MNILYCCIFVASLLLCVLFLISFDSLFQTHMLFLAVMDFVNGNRLTTSFLTFTIIEPYGICVMLHLHS